MHIAERRQGSGRDAVPLRMRVGLAGVWTVSDDACDGVAAHWQGPSPGPK